MYCIINILYENGIRLYIYGALMEIYFIFLFEILPTYYVESSHFLPAVMEKRKFLRKAVFFSLNTRESTLAFSFDLSLIYEN